LFYFGMSSCSVAFGGGEEGDHSRDWVDR